MCGISIVINTKGKVRPEVIKSVNDKVAHRGPDDEGFHVEDNFAFGHRRLSILDLSPAGHQPMPLNNLLITYNGEIYNYIELRDELREKGYTFKSGSDTEVILAAYEVWGTDAFAKFNGMWAFAIYDSAKREIVFCRDHFGIKPLYFTKTESYFLAGSEIKQFTAVEEFKPVLNRSAAVNFLVHGWLNYSDQTFFQGVQELRPGHFLRYNLSAHTFQVQEWYNLAKESVIINDSYAVAMQKVRALFLDSVRLRMRSDVRVGSCLSGGIDSSSIVSVIHRESLANADFATITSCYKDERFDEQRFSDTVTTQTGFHSAKVFPALDDLLEKGDFDKIIYHQDQPVSGASHYSEFNVFREARRLEMIVMQDGQGSDEFLCGYSEFYIVQVRAFLRSFRWGAALRLLKAKAQHRTRSLGQEVRAFVQTAYVFPLISFLKKMLGKNDPPWLSTEWKKIAADHLVEFPQHSIRQLSLLEIEQSSIPYQLHSEDRNSMLFSIESRLPFLDRRLVEYCIGLPSEYKIRDGYTKAILRDAIHELPEPIRKRKDKMGFVAPDAPWMLQNKDRIRKEIERIVQATTIFSPELLQRFDRFVKGELGYEPIYFRVLAFSRFCEIFKIRI